MVALAMVLAVVVVWRADVMQLEPVRLRLDNWRTALWVWSGSPAVGVGPGGFAQASQAVPFATGNRPRHAHSLPLEWLAEMGLIGGTAFVLAAVALWRLLRRLWPLRPELAVAVAVVPVHNLVDFSLYSSGVALPWAALVGWAVASSRPTPPANPSPRGRSLLILAATVIGLPFGLLVFRVVKWLGIAGIFFAVGRRVGRSLGREMSLLGAVLLVFLPFALLQIAPLLRPGPQHCPLPTLCSTGQD